MKRVDILYYLAIFGLFCINLIDMSDIINIADTYRTVIYMLIAILLVLKIIFTKYSKKQIIFIGILGIISLYTTYILNYYMFMINFLAIVAIKDVKINNVVKIDIALKLFFLAFSTIVYFIDYNNGVNVMISVGSTGVRHYLYLSHPNTAAGIAVWLAMDMLYISKKKWKTYIFTTIMVIFYYIFTVSRTAIIVYAVFSILLLISERKSEEFYQKTNVLLKYLIDIFAIVTVILMLLSMLSINTTVTDYINNILSGRLFYSQWALNAYGVNLLPNVNTRVLEDSLIVDNFYIRCLVSYGMINYLAISIPYKVLPKTVKNMDRIILLILPLYLFNEVFCFNVGRAIPMLILANAIFNQKNKKQELTKEDRGKGNLLVEEKLTEA